MIIQCPQCAARYRIDPSKSLKRVARVKCPKCTTLFDVELPLPGDSPRILVVDDSSFFRELILDVLRPLKAEILTAGDGNEALRAIRERRPALVILDLNLPGMSGYDLIRAVRSDAALEEIRLLAMSGVFRKESEVLDVKQAGANDFISKSFKPEQLLERVNRLLEG